MYIRSALCLACQFFALSICSDVAAQLTITDPGPTGVRQVSLSAPTGIVAARREASSRSQIRVEIRYLLVDDATRTAIFEGFEATEIDNSVTLPEPFDSAELQAVIAPSKSSRQIMSPARVTTCVLDDADVVLVLEKVGESPTSTLSSAPIVILIDGKEAEMNDAVQHPFVIDVATDGGVIKPSVQAFDDGTRLRLLAWLSDPAATPLPTSQEPLIGLACEINCSRVLDVRSDQLFGVQDQPVAVQTPIHEVTTVTASRNLSQGQTLLVDPHVTKPTTVQSESAVPVIGKLPYVGRSFRNISVASVEQHLIVLLRPLIEKHEP